MNKRYLRSSCSYCVGINFPVVPAELRAPAGLQQRPVWGGDGEMIRLHCEPHLWGETSIAVMLHEQPCSGISKQEANTCSYGSNVQALHFLPGPLHGMLGAG